MYKISVPVMNLNVKRSNHERLLEEIKDIVEKKDTVKKEEVIKEELSLDEEVEDDTELNLLDRKSLSITGVLKVICSNSNNIILKLKETNFEIIGRDLSINSFNENNINIDGNIDSLKYSKKFKNKESFFKRIFK